MDHRVKDLSLAEKGKQKIDWAEIHMPVPRCIKKKVWTLQAAVRYKNYRMLTCNKRNRCTYPNFKGGRSRNIVVWLQSIEYPGWYVAASLAKDESISVFASRGVSTLQYYEDIHSSMKIRPNITIDDGADLTVEMHKEGGKSKENVYGGTEETTTGVIRLRAMEKSVH